MWVAIPAYKVFVRHYSCDESFSDISFINRLGFSLVVKQDCPNSKITDCIVAVSDKKWDGATRLACGEHLNHFSLHTKMSLSVEENAQIEALVTSALLETMFQKR